MTATSLAQQLLDAQVRWTLEQLRGEELTALVTDLVDDVLGTGETCTVAQLLDPADIKSLARLALTRVPASTIASTMVQSGAQILVENPAGEYTLSELIDRQNVERLTDELLALTPILERGLDELTSSPIVASLASRFVGRIVNDVLAGNRAVAEKIPGVGSLMSLGTSVAGKAIGKTGEQFEQLFGETAAKGAEFAMSRLNKIIITTLNDPQTRSAVLEVFDRYADRPAGRHDRMVTAPDAIRLGGVVQDISIVAAASPPVLALIDAFIDAFFATYAGHPASVLLEDIALDRDDLVGYATSMAPRLFAAAADSGELEQIVRRRLAPFYDSPAVAEILAHV
ncbi:hypothetical protein GOHSU_13_00190 [Gordonia hirsuta DSM 44140 = NBRC 16056]|uniref:Uncharacterized protein n=1 Tax=Gordonia hirsuta DSM 44140 = NBRC 16056 TaxID=1121927 RepID=L7L9R7_9ACTN|nr:hypothetical protein [Gordonia hirsuta]GAC56797.1 hypothetical protein GOHSU_13_00190 [Gordonia hirsuta DSM 44140 = NBRC 16056]